MIRRGVRSVSVHSGSLGFVADDMLATALPSSFRSPAAHAQAKAYGAGVENC